MFTSRMPIPYPPPGCKTAYIQDSSILVVPEGASLIPLCVVCGQSSEVAVKRTFHWPRPELTGDRSRVVSESLEYLAYLFRRVFRLDDRVTLEIPLCSDHRSGQILRTWAGIASAAIGLVLLSLNFHSMGSLHSSGGWAWIGGFALIVGGVAFGFSGANALALVEFNNALAAYSGFGLDYMKKIPRAVDIFPPKRA